MAVQLWPPLVVFQTWRGVEEKVGVFGGPDERLGANRARGRFFSRSAAASATSSAASCSGADLGLLRGHAVKERDFATVDQVGVLGIGSGFAVLLDAHGMPVVESDLAIHAAAFDAGGAGILLSAAEAVGESVVGGDMVDGRSWLGVPVAPGFAAIGGDHRTLVGDQQDDVGVVGVDPAFLVIVAAGGAAHGGPGEAAIFGTPEDHGAAIDDVFVLGIDGNGGQVAAADAGERAVIGRMAVGAGFGHAWVVGGEEPVLAAIGGFVESDGAAAAPPRPPRPPPPPARGRRDGAPTAMVA